MGLERYFRKHFTRSICSNGLSLEHPDFKTYMAMRMRGENTKNLVGEELYKVLVEKYGVLPGIEDGYSIYKM